MQYSPDIIRDDEKLVFALRTLYSEHGYTPFKLSRFEEYSLYAANRTFLPSGDIIAFTDAAGMLKALRPDVTLSIVKNLGSTAGLSKLCYNENVYRTVDGDLKEQMQVGLECIGELDARQEAEVLLLAKKSLNILSGGAKTHLDVSHAAGENPATVAQLKELDSLFKKQGFSEGINIDFSVTGDVSYYTGIIFQGFIEGVPNKILVGGRYDRLLESFGKSGGAIGFAVHLDMMKQSDISASGDDKMLGIALPKGRLGEAVLEKLSVSGLAPADVSDNSRKLVIENPDRGVRYFWVKPSDVAIYVERGVADIGVVGRDTLLETHADVYELRDLELGKCRMCVAGIAGADMHTNKTLRVATKFPNIAREYFSGKGIDIDIIELHGSIELAPLLNLSDIIVDLVETGRTLKDNNMEVFETITDVSARLIANKSSYRFNKDAIDKILEFIK